MSLQHRLQFLPSDAEFINDHLAVVRDVERMTLFDAFGPIFTCALDDETALRFAAVMLTDPELGLATPSQIAEVLDRHRSRVHEYTKRYREGGTEALQVKRRGPRGPSKLKGTVLARAQKFRRLQKKFLNAGDSNRAVAKLVGVSELTIRKGLKDGRLF